MSDEADRQSVSIYLVRESKVVVAQTALSALGGTSYRLNDHIEGGAFIVLPSEASEPKWLDHVFIVLAEGESQSIELQGQVPGALLWIPHGARTAIITFGFAHTKIRDEWLEPDFGKITTFSVVPQGRVKELRSEQIFARRHIASERAPRAASVREFSFDADRDLVSTVEGTPEPAFQDLLGIRVRGGISFKLDLDFERLSETVPNFCGLANISAQQK